jgi:hypothetical protein
MTQMGEELQSEFERGMNVALAVAAAQPLTDASRIYLAGLAAGLGVALGEGLDDAACEQSLTELAVFVRAWREHHNARAN